MIAALALLLICLQRQHQAPRPELPSPGPPDVLLIVLDDVGWDAVGSLPSIFGPGGLAERGMTFERCYSAPLCTPSRLMMLSGQMPRRMGIGGNLDPLDPNMRPLPLLAETWPKLWTYASTALFGKWHLSWAESYQGRDPSISGPPTQGFSRWLAGNPAAPSLGPGASGYYNWWRVDDSEATLESRYASDCQVDAFLHWWAQEPNPKVAWLCLSSAHDPWDVPPGGIPQGSLRNEFLQTVAYADSLLYQVLGSVDLGSTFVAFVTDNGTPNSSRPPGSPSGRWKFTTYEGGIRVPLVIAGPGIEIGGVSQRLVSLTDLPATVAEVSGVASHMPDSRSFADELGQWAGSPARSWVFSERYSISYDDQSIVEDVWKLRRVDPDGSGDKPRRDWWYTVQGGADADVASAAVPADVRTRLLENLASLPARAP